MFNYEVKKFLKAAICEHNALKKCCSLPTSRLRRMAPLSLCQLRSRLHTSRADIGARNDANKTRAQKLSLPYQQIDGRQ